MSRELLEAHLHEDPDDLSAWAVYGDWLLEQGDVRGQILTLEAEMRARGTTRGRRARLEALVDQHHEQWLGPLLLAAMRTELGGDLFQVDPLHGFPRSARLGVSFDWEGPPVLDVLREILHNESFRFLQALKLGLIEAVGNDYAKVAALLSEVGPRPALRELVLGEFSLEETEISWTTVGPLDALLAAQPQLRSLQVRGGGIKLQALRHDKLERLVIETGGLPAASAKAVASGRASRLEHLEVWFGDPDYGGDATIDDLSALWGAEGYPSLVHLGLCNAAFTDTLVSRLAESPLLARLQELDLSKGTLSGQGAQALLDRRERFAHLRLLCLDENFVDSGVLNRLKKAFRQALSASDQRSPDRSGEEARYYVAVGE